MGRVFVQARTQPDDWQAIGFGVRRVDQLLLIFRY
jgi:hypothetical protein